MTLIDTLRPEHRRLLRRLRKRIANRENMRRCRNDINDMQLCPGVDQPLEAGTCGRLTWPESTRYTGCRKRRNWLLQHALNPVEVALSAPLDGAEADDAEHDDGADEDSARPSPCSTSCPHSAIRACAGSARSCAQSKSRSHRPTCCPARSPDRAGRSRRTHAGGEIVSGEPHFCRPGPARRCSNLRQPATSGCGWLKSNPQAEENLYAVGNKSRPDDV